MKQESFRKKAERTFREICQKNGLRMGAIASAYDDWYLTILIRLQNTMKKFNEETFAELLRNKTDALYQLAGTEKEYMMNKCESILVLWEGVINGNQDIHNEVWARWKDNPKFWFNKPELHSPSH